MNVYIKKQNLFFQKILIQIGILILLLVFLNVFQNQVRNYFYFAYSSISNVFSTSGRNSSIFLETFLNYRGLKNENNNLKEENRKLLFGVSVLKESLGENQNLQQILESNQLNNFTTVLTKIVQLDIQNDFMLINKGSNDLIAENMPVISSQKVLYGKVFKVYESFSQVMLISNKNSVLDVKIQNSDLTISPVHGAIKGQGNLTLGLGLVNSDEQLLENEFLVTSGLEGIFPENLLVGKITSVNKNDLQPFQTAKIQSFLDFKNIENLFLITDYKK